MVNMTEPPREAEAGEAGEESQPKRRKLEGEGDEAGAEDGSASIGGEPSGGGDVSSLVEELPKEISEALDELDLCQREIDTLNEKASEEILKVEQKYNGLRKPMYGKRTEIIAKIPQFWLTAFSNHPQMAAMIDEEEEKCLQYLRDMVVEENDDIKSGYKIKFIFEDNPYFENAELVKDVHLPYGSPDERPYVVSTQIKWKKGMDLLKVKDKKPKKRSRWPDNNQSFLEWITQDGDPSGDEIAEILKDDMWPNPMQYYLAPDVDVEENGMEDEDDDEEGLEEDDSEDGEDPVVVVEEDDEEGQMVEEDEEDVEEEEGGAEGEAGGAVEAGDPEDDEEAEDEEP